MSSSDADTVRFLVNGAILELQPLELPSQELPPLLNPAAAATVEFLQKSVKAVPSVRFTSECPQAAFDLKQYDVAKGTDMGDVIASVIYPPYVVGDRVWVKGVAIAKSWCSEEELAALKQELIAEEKQWFDSLWYLHHGTERQLICYIQQQQDIAKLRDLQNQMKRIRCRQDLKNMVYQHNQPLENLSQCV